MSYYSDEDNGDEVGESAYEANLNPRTTWSGRTESPRGSSRHWLPPSGYQTAEPQSRGRSIKPAPSSISKESIVMSGALRENDPVPEDPDRSNWRDRSVTPTPYPIFHDPKEPLNFIRGYFDKKGSEQEAETKAAELADRMEQLALQRQQKWTLDCDWDPTKEQYDEYQRVYETKKLTGQNQVASGSYRSGREQVNKGNRQTQEAISEDGKIDVRDFAYPPLNSPQSPMDSAHGSKGKWKDRESEGSTDDA